MHSTKSRLEDNWPADSRQKNLSLCPAHLLLCNLIVEESDQLSSLQEEGSLWNKEYQGQKKKDTPAQPVR